MYNTKQKPLIKSAIGKQDKTSARGQFVHYGLTESLFSRETKDNGARDQILGFRMSSDVRAAYITISMRDVGSYTSEIVKYNGVCAIYPEIQINETCYSN
ncbi:MAG TPA: hypothetical protein VEL11_04855 [Candidatus Bathyarchaeia archaeon]|nr:hypothetical protein [Candidatus Bathyarchaeia archaeon]